MSRALDGSVPSSVASDGSDLLYGTTAPPSEPPALALRPGAPAPAATPRSDVQRFVVHLTDDGLGAQFEPNEGAPPGFVITRLTRGSLAYRLGLTAGDVLVQLNKVAVSTATHPLSKLLDEIKNLKTATFDFQLCPRLRLKVPHPTPVPHSTGVVLRQSRIVPGFRVTSVERSCPVDLAGLVEEDLLIAINEVDITSWPLENVMAELAYPTKHTLTAIKGMPEPPPKDAPVGAAPALKRTTSRRLLGDEPRRSGSMFNLLTRASSTNNLHSSSEGSPEPAEVGPDGAPVRRTSMFRLLDRKASRRALDAEQGKPPLQSALSKSSEDVNADAAQRPSGINLLGRGGASRTNLASDKERTRSEPSSPEQATGSEERKSPVSKPGVISFLRGLGRSTENLSKAGNEENVRMNKTGASAGNPAGDQHASGSLSA